MVDLFVLLEEEEKEEDKRTTTTRSRNNNDVHRRCSSSYYSTTAQNHTTWIGNNNNNGGGGGEWDGEQQQLNEQQQQGGRRRRWSSCQRRWRPQKNGALFINNNNDSSSSPTPTGGGGGIGGRSVVTNENINISTKSLAVINNGGGDLGAISNNKKKNGTIIVKKNQNQNYPAAPENTTTAAEPKEEEEPEGSAAAAVGEDNDICSVTRSDNNKLPETTAKVSVAAAAAVGTRDNWRRNVKLENGNLCQQQQGRCICCRCSRGQLGRRSVRCYQKQQESVERSKHTEANQTKEGVERTNENTGNNRFRRFPFSRSSFSQKSAATNDPRKEEEEPPSHRRGHDYYYNSKIDSKNSKNVQQGFSFSKSTPILQRNPHHPHHSNINNNNLWSSSNKTDGDETFFESSHDWYRSLFRPRNLSENDNETNGHEYHHVHCNSIGGQQELIIESESEEEEEEEGDYGGDHRSSSASDNNNSLPNWLILKLLRKELFHLRAPVTTTSSGGGPASIVSDTTTIGVGLRLCRRRRRRKQRRIFYSYRSEEPVTSTSMDISTGHIILSYLEEHLDKEERVREEWAGITSTEHDIALSSNLAKLPHNQGRNRTQQVLPYDVVGIKLEDGEYINASPIYDHDPQSPVYIATQGPLPDTVQHFWQMVWEQGSVVIVNLTQLVEDGLQMCHRYWPENGSEVYGIYEVHLVSEHIWCEDYLVRSFYLKNLNTKETRTVTQFHFLSWKDKSIPANPKSLLEFRRKVNKSYRGRACPIIVHCSDGAGRSGTYSLIDMVLNRINKGVKEMNMAGTVEHLRDQRMCMVGSEGQYRFALTTVAQEVADILKALPNH